MRHQLFKNVNKKSVLRLFNDCLRANTMRRENTGCDIVSRPQFLITVKNILDHGVKVGDDKLT